MKQNGCMSRLCSKFVKIHKHGDHVVIDSLLGSPQVFRQNYSDGPGRGTGILWG
jgi:hypothetical protein